MLQLERFRRQARPLLVLVHKVLLVLLDQLALLVLRGPPVQRVLQGQQVLRGQQALWGQQVLKGR